MKLLTILFALFIASFAWGAETVSFEELYKFDLMKKMMTPITKGQCIDLKEHFENSRGFILGTGKMSYHENRSKKLSRSEALKICKDNLSIKRKGALIPICESLEELLDLKREYAELNKARKPLLISLGREVSNLSYFMGKSTTKPFLKDCRQSVEYSSVSKLHRIMIAKFLSDNGIAQKVIYKYDGHLDGGDVGEDWVNDLQDDCVAEMKYVQVLLGKEMDRMIKGKCLSELASKGLILSKK